MVQVVDRIIECVADKSGTKPVDKVFWIGCKFVVVLVAVIQSAIGSAQAQSSITALADLPQDLAESGIDSPASPAIIVIGDVVRCAVSSVKDDFCETALARETVQERLSA